MRSHERGGSHEARRITRGHRSWWLLLSGDGLAVDSLGGGNRGGHGTSPTSKGRETSGRSHVKE